ncbi:hypothetical protein CDD83_3969 [Cordyceps sp. RAO-2017]|nr:hypothetical protein CDD83_3969 [Cordyceps sp. RAO-2017]
MTHLPTARRWVNWRAWLGNGKFGRHEKYRGGYGGRLKSVARRRLHPANICGLVTAKTESAFRTLFEQAFDASVEVYPEKLIPLRQIAKVLPIDDELEIHVDLWDCDSDASTNDRIAQA